MPGTQSWETGRLADLRAMWGKWDIWWVPVYRGPDWWCAKPAGAPVSTISVHSPDELELAIADAEFPV